MSNYEKMNERERERGVEGCERVMSFIYMNEMDMWFTVPVVGQVCSYAVAESL